MKFIFFIAVMFLGWTACSHEPSKDLDEDTTTNSFQKAADSCECKGWVRVKSDPTAVTCEDECYQLLPANDSVKLALENIQGGCIDFTGNFYQEKQPFGEDGDLVKTFVYTGFKVISNIGSSEKSEESYSSVIAFEKIDTNNFFRSFVAYVQNGNINDMLYFYDSAYVMRHCVSALENDTARCMNEQFCGYEIKGEELGEQIVCVDFIEIEKIQFVGTETEGDERFAYFKITSTEGKKVKIGWEYRVANKNGKAVFGFIGKGG